MTPYTCIWEFEVRPGREAEFERHYGPDGSWVQLFRTASGYIDTVLLRDLTGGRRYLTIDRWESEPAYRAFRTTHGVDYSALDSRCEDLTAAERELGRFETVPQQSGEDSFPVTPVGVALEVAGSDQAPLLANLLELYCHDMSEIFPLEVRADGRFGYDRLPLYWSRPDTHFPFIIRSGGHVAGLALVTRGSPASTDPTIWDVAEFFILRAHRRSGVGRQAASLLWNRFPGQWTVRVLKTNRAGIPFWERAVREYSRGVFSQGEHEYKSHSYRVFSFRSVAV